VAPRNAPMSISDFEASTLNIITYQVVTWKDTDISVTAVPCEDDLGGSAVQSLGPRQRDCWSRGFESS
jgi:hypothetical protein